MLWVDPKRLGKLPGFQEIYSIKPLPLDEHLQLLVMETLLIRQKGWAELRKMPQHHLLSSRLPDCSPRLPCLRGQNSFL